jgi:2-polyprenyl-3-methyl-5-hydroxy-6-metoxy-1,4-benzoquinol methylase
MNPAMRRCNLCGASSRFKMIEDSAKPFHVLKCTRCGLIFVDPIPELPLLANHYDADYYAAWLETQKEERQQMWGRRLKTIEKRFRTGRLLDVGCATGTFLQLAKKNGWEIRGTEYSLYAAKFAGDLLKADIYCGHLMDARYEDSSFDVITFWHVLEHLHDPMRYLKEAHRILKPSGLLVIAVPNVNDYIMQFAYRLVKGRSLKLFSEDDREIHLYHFSAQTLSNYLQKTGFECLKISPDYGITECSKKVVNVIAVALFYATGLKIFNALEAHAVRI